MQKAASLLANAIDKNFDKWELYSLQKVFCLPPPQMELVENENVAAVSSNSLVVDDSLSPQQLDSIRNYLRVKSLRLRLEKELQCVRARVQMMKQSQQLLKPIVSATLEIGVKELKDTLEYGSELKSVKEKSLALDDKVSVLLMDDKAKLEKSEMNENQQQQKQQQQQMVKEEQLYNDLKTRSKELEMMVL
jgi:hypothetical protein